MDVVLDRDALYYPYIHIRDANWLKAALLTFPQVRRIVPQDFEPNDREEVKPFRRTIGARGPLLADEPAYLYSAYEAQNRLRDRLERSDPDQLARFSRASTELEYPENPNAFQMHAGKMLPLLDFLRSKDLAWPARAIATTNPGDWFALHPQLGEVVMSLIAMAIAGEKQLDIVTSSGRIHRALAHMDEAALVGSLFGTSMRGPRLVSDPSEIADELCQTVMLTAFNLSEVTADGIAELQKDGKDLRRFKSEILKIAAAIPDIPDHAEREKRLTYAAQEVMAEWEKYRKSLPRFAIDALLSAASWKPPELLATVLAGAASTAVLASGTGLLIGLGVYAGMGVWRGYKEKASSPYQYLSQIQRAGASLSPRPVIAAKRSLMPS